MSEKAMDNEHISLGEFVKQLTLKFDEEQLFMPLRDERPWHVFFYKLKSETAPEQKPAFLQELLFDWDGPYPRSPELADYINALHWTGCVSAANPQYDEITLNEKVKEIWSGIPLSPELVKFVDYAVAKAKQEFVSQ